MKIKAVILAAGGAKRMEPLSKVIKKPLVPVGRYPITLLIIRTILKAGISDIIIVHGAEEQEMKNTITIHSVMKCCEDLNVDWNSVHLQFVLQEKPGGMAEAISLTRKSLSEADDKISPFLLTSADIYFGEDVPKMLIEHFKAKDHNSILAIVSTNDDKIAESHGNVLIKNDRVEKIIEKPGKNKISDDYSMPIYVFSGDLFDFIDKVPISARGEKELQDAIQFMIASGKPIYSCKILEDNLYSNEDIGKYHITYPSDVLRMNFHLLKGMIMDFEGEYPTAMGPVALYRPKLGDNTFLGPFAIVHQDAELEKFCEIQKTIVFNNAKVGAYSKLYNCIVGPNAIVEANQVYRNKLFIKLSGSSETKIFDLK
jgi:NDP-sugar pyrophosphorylase family protein